MEETNSPQVVGSVPDNQIIGDVVLAEAYGQLFTESLATVAELTPESGMQASRCLPDFGLQVHFGTLKEALETHILQVPPKSAAPPMAPPTATANDSASAGPGFWKMLWCIDSSRGFLPEALPPSPPPSPRPRHYKVYADQLFQLIFSSGALLAREDTELEPELPLLSAWISKQMGQRMDFSAVKFATGGHMDIVRVLRTNASEAVLATWISQQTGGRSSYGTFMLVDPGEAAQTSGVATLPAHSSNEAQSTAASTILRAPGVSPGDSDDRNSCYIVGEATSDWRRVSQKLVQLERDLWVLALRIELKRVARNASPRLNTSIFVDRIKDGTLAADWFGLAYILILDSYSATEKEAKAQRQAVTAGIRAVSRHPLFEHVFPLCAALIKKKRLGLVFSKRNTEKLVAGAVLQGVAHTHSIASMKSQLSSIQSDVASIKSDVDSIKTTMERMAAFMKASHDVSQVPTSISEASTS